MRTLYCFFPVLIVMLAAVTKAGEASDLLIGEWYTEGGKALFEFYKVGDEYRARLNPLEKPAMIDQKNPVDSLRSRKIKGATTIWNLRYNSGSGRWEDGRVYNPSNGKTYRCHCLLLEGGNQLEFRGYLGVSALGQSRTWIRKQAIDHDSSTAEKQ